MMESGRLLDRRAGFNLIVMSLFIMVASVIMAAMLSGGDAGDINTKSMNTVVNLSKVEQAMTAFMVMNGRLPCPADGSYGVNTANFGIEAATPGTCTGGTPAANFGPDAGTGYVVGGTIPTKSLWLDDSYAFDEWGRRITYVVDKRATLKSSCITLQNFPVNNGVGGIKIESSTGGTVIANVMHAFISHGPDGHGAFPEAGSSVANRINTGSIDTDKLTNAGVDSSFTYNTTNFTNVKVMKDRTATFGDLVYYATYQQNTCCVGGATYCSAVAATPGFRIDGSAIPSGFGIGAGITHGDINGDGNQDLVIVAPPEAGGGVYVIFGQTGGGYANPLSVASLGGTATAPYGFHVYDSTDSNVGSTIGVGDINGDGYADIVMCDNGYGFCDVFYGHSGSFNASYDVKTASTCVNTQFGDGGGSGGRISSIIIADVNNDGYKDLIVGDWNGSSGKNVFVVFGRANTCPGTDPIPWGTNIKTLTNASTPKVTTIVGSSSTGSYGEFMAVGDVNGDGLNDILIGDWRYSSGSKSGRTYIVAGQTGTWPSTITLSGLTGIPNYNTTNPVCSATAGAGGTDNTAKCGTVMYGYGDCQTGLSVGDVTGDGVADIISEWANCNDGSGNGTTLIKGGAGNFTAASYLTGPGGTAGTLLKLGLAYQFATGGTGSMIGGTWYEGAAGFMIGDINGDGTGDLIFPAAGDGTYPTAYGSVYVLFGSGSLMAGGNLYSSPPNGTTGVRIDCPYASQDGRVAGSCGYGLDEVDMNGDGIKDLVIGVPGGNVTGSNREGYIYVLYGKSSGWTSTYSLGNIY